MQSRFVIALAFGLFSTAALAQTDTAAPTARLTPEQRQERRAAWQNASPEERQQMRANAKAKFQSLPPEQQEKIKARLQERRSLHQQRRAGGTAQ